MSRYDTRVNLRIYALDENNAAVYHVLHIGFFPHSATKGIVERLNARSIAFHFDAPRQTGEVEIVTCLMGPLPNPEIIARCEMYEPRKEAEQAL